MCYNIILFLPPDVSCRFEGIVIVRNGGSYGAVSANWSIIRNSSDQTPVSDDLQPAAGTVNFAAGQVTAVIPINIVADDLPEEAEAFLLQLLPNTVTGNAELDEPTEVSLEVTFVSFGFCLHVSLLCAAVIGQMLHLLGNMFPRCCSCVTHV